LIVITNGPAPSDAIFTGFRGDVTPNGVILLRFRGALPDGNDGAARGRATSFLAHELFHLWNGRRSDHPNSEAWLHEGSADYFSWLAVAGLWPEEISLEQKLQSALNTCMAFLGARPVSGMTGELAGLRYPCGSIAHWIVDVGARGASHGRSTGFDLWARLLAQNPAQGDYSLGSFRAAAAELAPGTKTLLDAFIDRGLGWEELAPVLAAQGSDVTLGPPSPIALRFAAARSIALSLCTGFSGAGEGAIGAFFTAECGELGGEVYLVRIAGHDPMSAPQAMLERVRTACGTGSELDLALRVGETTLERTIRCAVPVESPVPDIVIRRALPDVPET
jgi:hypothetical protein